MTETTFNSDTPADVRRVLENARISGRRVRLFYGDRMTGRDWCEESDVIGTIGRSGGRVRVPIILANARSVGGPSVLDSCILRIVDAKTKRELYRAANYQMPAFDVRAGSSVDGYAAELWRDGDVWARCRSLESAQRLAAFLRGERMAP